MRRCPLISIPFYYFSERNLNKMDFSRYLIATDLDGTFLGPGGVRVERNMQAVERFKAGGGLFTVATGRVHVNIRNAIGDPEKLLNAPAVMSNGCYLYDFDKKRAVQEVLLPSRTAGELLRFVKDCFADVAFRVSTPHGLRVERTDGYVGRDLHWYDEGVVEVSPCETWPTDDWYKIVFRQEAARLTELRAALTERFAAYLSFTSSGTQYLEVQCVNCNKANGLEKLRRVCGADRILIACGDFENDMEMLRAADVAICPENAMDAVKRIAHHVLCHCKDGLIADVIEKIEVGEL